MATVQEQYCEMLEQLPDSTKIQLIEHAGFANVYKEVDPVSYRCGLADFQPQCEECGHEYWPDSFDDEAICEDCLDNQELED